METEMASGHYRRSGQRWTLVWVGVFLVAIAAVVVARLLVQPAGYPWYPFGFGWIWIPFAFFFLFFVLRWFFWPWGWGYGRGYWTGDDAYSILRERFARGEITKEQFEQMSRDLQEHTRA